MATRPNTTGGASAPSNVVRLPTAAPRRVDNSRFADQRRASYAARKASHWEWQTPLEREKRAEARMLGLEKTPELLLAMCLLKHSSPEVQNAVFNEIQKTLFGLPDDKSAAAAYHIASHLLGRGL